MYPPFLSKPAVCVARCQSVKHEETLKNVHGKIERDAHEIDQQIKIQMRLRSTLSWLNRYTRHIESKLVCSQATRTEQTRRLRADRNVWRDKANRSLADIEVLIGAIEKGGHTIKGLQSRVSQLEFDKAALEATIVRMKTPRKRVRKSRSQGRSENIEATRISEPQ